MKDDFDWNDDSIEEDLIVPEQKATACYFSNTGVVVIRQNSHNGIDPYVTMRPEYVPLLVLKLQHLFENGMANRRTDGKKSTDVVDDVKPMLIKP